MLSKKIPVCRCGCLKMKMLPAFKSEIHKAKLFCNRCGRFVKYANKKEVKKWVDNFNGGIKIGR